MNLNSHERNFLEDISTYVFKDIEVLERKEIIASKSFDIDEFLGWMQKNSTAPIERMRIIFDSMIQVANDIDQATQNVNENDELIQTSYSDDIEFRRYRERDAEDWRFFYQVHQNAHDVDDWSSPRDPGGLRDDCDHW